MIQTKTPRTIKKAYTLLCLLIALASTIAHGQSPPTDVPLLRNHKPAEPFIGFTANIPLLKLLGKKKVKPLPKQPESASSQLIDQFAEPVGITKPAKSSSQKPENPFEFKPDNRKDFPVLPFLNVDLDEVIVVGHRPVTHYFFPLPKPKNADEAGGGSSGGDGSSGEGSDPGSTTPQSDPYKPYFNDASCDAYSDFFQKSIDENKEQVGLITADGKFITLPSFQNTHIAFTVSNSYDDLNGNRTVRFQQNSSGIWQVILFNEAGEAVYKGEVTSMIHTHPDLPEGQRGTYRASFADKTVAQSYPGLRQYIKTSHSSFEFNEDGNVFSTSFPLNSLPNCN